MSSERTNLEVGAGAGELSLSELEERRASELAELESRYVVERAELELLEAFDTRRQRVGHDYGAGQRGAELQRRRRALEELAEAIGRRMWRAEELERRAELMLRPATGAELLEAFERIGAPRVKRLMNESYRALTPSSARTRRTWNELEHSVRTIARRQAGA